MLDKNRSNFIVFEGIDFSGKDTQIGLLNSYFNKSIGSNSSTIVSTISKGLLGRTIREYLAMEKLPVNNIAMGAIFTGELAIAQSTVLEAKSKFPFVIGNRWYYSTIAYNSDTYEEKEEIKKMNSVIMKPDLVIYLDLDPKIAMERKSSRIGKNTEVFETLENLERVYEKYNSILDNDYRGHDIIRVNADQSEMDVHDEIIRSLNWEKQEL